ncbi:LOW QUALITY PROTEIN: hypothetical protein M8C21_016822 [Ambrosia artemisiifolia]|uniref:Calmodulin binding protein-like N-terminal domain-containing protein n=1 Tax=Ambrosia artemisiifolia TaxID=4212 RepID=A0AAD5D4U8_AMBAR|nr:LOW QUALITY PROTEIN: hypothetical protein M8C21_016822 [Ambrosia artemisiifolia]
MLWRLMMITMKITGAKTTVAGNVVVKTSDDLTTSGSIDPLILPGHMALQLQRTMPMLNHQSPEEEKSDSNTTSSDPLSNLTRGADGNSNITLKLTFRNRIGLPVYTGIPLLGEYQTPFEIALVDAFIEQKVNIGTESTAKLKIMGFRVGDDDDDGGWTFEVC